MLSRKEKLGKLSFYTKEAIGMPYGTVFEVDRGKLIPKQAATESAIDSLIKAGNLGAWFRGRKRFLVVALAQRTILCRGLSGVPVPRCCCRACTRVHIV